MSTDMDTEEGASNVQLDDATLKALGDALGMARKALDTLSKEEIDALAREKLGEDAVTSLKEAAGNIEGVLNTVSTDGAPPYTHKTKTYKEEGKPLAAQFADVTPTEEQAKHENINEEKVAELIKEMQELCNQIIGNGAYIAKGAINDKTNGKRDYLETDSMLGRETSLVMEEILARTLLASNPNSLTTNFSLAQRAYTEQNAQAVIDFLSSEKGGDLAPEEAKRLIEIQQILDDAGVWEDSYVRGQILVVNKEVVLNAPAGNDPNFAQADHSAEPHRTIAAAGSAPSNSG